MLLNISDRVNTIIKFPFINSIIRKLNYFSKNPIKALYNLHKLNLYRHKRIERCTVLAHCLMVMMPDMNFADMQIGYYNKAGRFISKWSYAELSAITGHSLIAIKRAFHDAKRAGYIHVDRSHKLLQNGKYVAHNGIKRFTQVFFEHLGINSIWWKQMRSWRRKKEGFVKKQQQFFTGPKIMGITGVKAASHNNPVKIMHKSYITEVLEKAQAISEKAKSVIGWDSLSPLERINALKT